MTQEDNGLEAQALALALNAALESAAAQAWLRTRPGQMWLSGLKMDVELASPGYMEEITRCAERYDAPLQECAPRCAL